MRQRRTAYGVWRDGFGTSVANAAAFGFYLAVVLATGGCGSPEVVAGGGAAGKFSGYTSKQPDGRASRAVGAYDIAGSLGDSAAMVAITLDPAGEHLARRLPELDVARATLQQSLLEHHHEKFCDSFPWIDGGPSLADCSGFLVAPDIVATAGHCVTHIGSCERMRFFFDYYFHDRARTRLRPLVGNRVALCKHVLARTQLVADDPNLDQHHRDVALVQLDRPIGRRPMKLEERADAGESIFGLGFPLGTPLVANRGTLLAVDESGIRSNMTSAVGMSGGPLVNEAGLVVGINVGRRLGDGGRFTFRDGTPCPINVVRTATGCLDAADNAWAVAMPAALFNYRQLLDHPGSRPIWVFDRWNPDGPLPRSLEPGEPFGASYFAPGDGPEVPQTLMVSARYGRRPGQSGNEPPVSPRIAIAVEHGDWSQRFVVAKRDQQPSDLVALPAIDSSTFIFFQSADVRGQTLSGTWRVTINNLEDSSDYLPLVSLQVYLVAVAP